MRGPRRFYQRGSNFDQKIFYFVYRGIEDPNTAINGPSSVRQRNAIGMAFRWRADDGTTLNAGLVALRIFFKEIRTSITKKPYIFLFIQRGPPSESAHEHVQVLTCWSCRGLLFSCLYLIHLIHK